MKTVLLIDDDMSSPTPSPFSCRVLEKLKACVAAAHCAVSIPDSMAKALKAPKPDLLLLDIDLSGWGRRCQGFEYWETMTQFRNVPLIVLSAEPKQKIHFFSQKRGVKVEWWPKDVFLKADDDFLANQFLSMSSDIENTQLEVVLDTENFWLKVLDGPVSIADIALEDPQVPVNAPFSSRMSPGQIKFHLIRALICEGQISSSSLTSAFTDHYIPRIKQQRFLGEFNKDVRLRTRGRVGYKLIVNEARNLKLKAKINPTTNYPGKLTKGNLPTSDLARIEGLIKDLGDRLYVLETAWGLKAVSTKGHPKKGSRP